MTEPTRTVVRVHDTNVRTRSPLVAAALCVLTVGVIGATRHGKVNGELRRLGRARGAMTFPFIRVHPALSVLAWILGFVMWVLVVATIVVYSHDLAIDRHDFEPGDITSLAGSLILLAPLWLTALHTGQRLHTAQHLVGVTPRRNLPVQLAVASIVFPPLGTWRLQREANRAWSTWRNA